MSQVEVLHAPCTIDFTLTLSPTHADSLWPTKFNPHLILPSMPHISPNSFSSEPRVDSGASIFPSLPPLHYGHPNFHMRAGVLNASRLADADEPNAEKAFFVADLSQVYRQHQRWKACLPEIQPFYGTSCGHGSLTRADDATLHFQP